MTDCGAPRHDGDQNGPQTLQGTHLCAPCQARMRADLRRLPALTRQLEQMLDPRQRGQRALLNPGEGLPYNDPAAELLSQIRHDTQTLARWVLDAGRAASCPVPLVGAVCAWLHGWSPWIAVQEWAPHAAGALAADCGRARALIDPMPCAVIDIPADRNWCPRCGQAGGLRAYVWQHPADRRPCVLECGNCDYYWDTTRWLHVGRDILRHVGVAA